MNPIELSILSFQDNWYFSPIRNSIDYIRILLRTCQNLLVNSVVEGISSHVIGEIKIIVNKKFSRVFYFKDDKFYSLYFPFKVIEDIDNNSYDIYLDEILLDSKLISEINSIIDNSLYTEQNSILEFYNFYPEDQERVSDDSMMCLEKLIHIEPSYIRYDYDVENENETFHPLNHFDINYTERSKIKVGIKNKIDFDFFRDFLDNEKECIYLDR